MPRMPERCPDCGERRSITLLDALEKRPIECEICADNVADEMTPAPGDDQRAAEAAEAIGRLLRPVLH